MKKIVLLLALVFSAATLQAYNHCMCPPVISGTTMTVIDFYVEGGCCSGIAVQGLPMGGISSLEQNEGNTWIEVDYHLLSNEVAQGMCCG